MFFFYVFFFRGVSLSKCVRPGRPLPGLGSNCPRSLTPLRAEQPQ